MALCRQLLGAAVDTDQPLELACKKEYTQIGFYKGMVVAIKPIYKKSIDLTRNIRKELKQVCHKFLFLFVGILRIYIFLECFKIVLFEK